jgi:AraC-like DNA-binding protein
MLLAALWIGRLFSATRGVISGQNVTQSKSATALVANPQQAYFEALLEVVRADGVSTEALLRHARHGKPAQGLPDFIELCGSAIELTGNAQLGIAFGARLDLTSHGILGYALMSSRTVAQALQRLVRYIGLAAPPIHFEQIMQGSRCLLVCRPEPELVPQQFYLDAVLVAVIVSAHTLLGGRVAREAELWFTGPQPPHAGQYEAAAGVAVAFDRPYNAVSMPRRYLDAPVLSAEPAMAELCRQQCEKLLANMRDRRGLAGRIREQLLRAPGHFPDIERIALQYGLSERTLRRRLTDEGTAYRTLIDEVRLELARTYLASTTLPVAEIAALLGYDDPANFRRAFKRMQRQSPADYRGAPTP